MSSNTSNYVERVIKLQKRRKGDEICADCRSKDPRWASYNLGIFICLNCSGIHRSLGTHVSKVKSLDLDTWTKEQYKAIKSVGNILANKYWESTLGEKVEPPLSNMDYWIKQKYVEKAFVSKDGNVPTLLLDEDEEEDNQPELKKKVTKDKRASGYSIAQAQLLMKDISAPSPIEKVDSNTKLHPVTLLKGANFFTISSEPWV